LRSTKRWDGAVQALEFLEPTAASRQPSLAQGELLWPVNPATFCAMRWQEGTVVCPKILLNEPPRRDLLVQLALRARKEERHPAFSKGGEFCDRSRFAPLGGSGEGDGVCVPPIAKGFKATSGGHLHIKFGEAALIVETKAGRRVERKEPFRKEPRATGGDGSRRTTTQPRTTGRGLS